MDNSCCGGHFTGNVGIRVLRNDGVENRVGNLVADFVRMAFRHGLRSKKMF